MVIRPERAAPKGHHLEQREQDTLQRTCAPASKLRRDQHMQSELLRLHGICIRMEVTPIRQGPRLLRSGQLSLPETAGNLDELADVLERLLDQRQLVQHGLLGLLGRGLAWRHICARRGAQTCRCGSWRRAGDSMALARPSSLLRVIWAYGRPWHG